MTNRDDIYNGVRAFGITVNEADQAIRTIRSSVENTTELTQILSILTREIEARERKLRRQLLAKIVLGIVLGIFVNVALYFAAWLASGFPP